VQTERIKAFIVGIVIALICSVLVSGSVVLLKPIQEKSREQDRINNIVLAAGFSEEEISTVFTQFKPLMVKLEDGSYSDENINAQAWYADFNVMLRTPSAVTPLEKDEDVAAIGVKPKEMLAYVYYENDKPEIAVLQIYGAGLWSTMYGYLAIDLNDESIMGIKFYSHGETPGLGGEIDNPRWQAKWVGRSIYDPEGEVVFYFSRTPVTASTANAMYKVDSLSGATLTTEGLRNTIYFWMGPNGYKPFIDNIRGAE
jgi:Na+-transporting NADH:ubiquinone oxidoreductase subunit C